jgi:hypothetical protein
MAEQSAVSEFVVEALVSGAIDSIAYVAGVVANAPDWQTLTVDGEVVLPETPAVQFTVGAEGSYTTFRVFESDENAAVIEQLLGLGDGSRVEVAYQPVNKPRAGGGGFSSYNLPLGVGVTLATERTQGSDLEGAVERRAVKAAAPRRGRGVRLFA